MAQRARDSIKVVYSGQLQITTKWNGMKNNYPSITILHEITELYSDDFSFNRIDLIKEIV